MFRVKGYSPGGLAPISFSGISSAVYVNHDSINGGLEFFFPFLQFCHDAYHFLPARIFPQLIITLQDDICNDKITATIRQRR
jgi:hypothetical protein